MVTLKNIEILSIYSAISKIFAISEQKLGIITNPEIENWLFDLVVKLQPTVISLKNLQNKKITEFGGKENNGIIVFDNTEKELAYNKYMFELDAQENTILINKKEKEKVLNALPFVPIGIKFGLYPVLKIEKEENQEIKQE